MIFVYNRWDTFCRKLASKGLQSIPTKDIILATNQYIVLKHDVETDINKAYKLASIEHKYCHVARDAADGA